jgi:hypothetical protein
MKFTLKAIVFPLILAFALVACESGEQFLIRKDGLWKMESLQKKIHHDGNFVSDITRTDSLGQVYFDESGSGYRTDYAGNQETMTWSLNSKDDKLTMYFQFGEFADAKITSKSSDAMTLDWTYEKGEFGVLISTQTTMKIKRIQ